jgi:hypothetical protein
MIRSPGASAPTPRTYDKQAFNELAAQADRANSAFELNAIDRGLDRLIEHPNRSTSGTTLANRLTRDARKYLRTSRRAEILSDGIEQNDHRFDPPTPEELADIRFAVGVIRIGLSSLGPRHLLVLMTKATGGPSDALGVKARQYRNLVTDTRERLWAEPGVAAACELVVEALGRWRFETIELLAPLTAGLYSAN